MMPATMAAAAVRRRTALPSPSSRPPNSTPNRTLTSRHGAATLTAVNVAGKQPRAALAFQGWFYALLAAEAADPSPVLKIAW